MKNIILLFGCFLINIFVYSQTDFFSIIKAGDEALKRKDYQGALNQYNAAEAWDADPGKKIIVKKKIDSLFKKISQLGGASLSAQKQIKKLLDTIQYQKETIKTSLDLASTNIARSQKFINGLNLVNDNLAIAFNVPKGGSSPGYGFINKNGETVINFIYNNASPFDYTGFAQVEAIRKQDTAWKPSIYLIDTSGNEFKLANTVMNLDPSITALDLRTSEIDDFPTEIFSHPQLKIILFQSTEPTSYVLPIPKEFQKMKNLECLSTFSFVIDSLPAEIGQLDNLRSLIISHSGLKILPPEIIQLKKIQTLDLSGNSMMLFPGDILKLTSLRSLNLASNSFKELPNQIGNLESLRILDLQWNRLSKLPPQIGSLKNLKSLNLDKNLLEGLPPEIGQLTNLQELVISGNQLASFPLQILPLKNLESLDLSSNKSLKSLPPEISKLTNLRSLKLIGTSIPDAEQQKIKALLPWCYIIFK